MIKKFNVWWSLEWYRFRKLKNALKIANELKNYETNDTGISEVKKGRFAKSFWQIYSGQKKYKKAIDSYLLALDILNKSFEKIYKENILNNLVLAYNNIGETELANKYIKLLLPRRK